ITTSSTAAKAVYAQALAVALGIYADTRSLGGQALADNGWAVAYGFNISLAGGGGSPYTVGSGNTTAFPTRMGTSPTVLAILQKVNASFTPSNGYFYGSSSSNTGTTQANTVLSGINTGGDIALVTSDSASTGADAALITSLKPLNTGELVVAV